MKVNNFLAVFIFFIYILMPHNISMSQIVLHFLHNTSVLSFYIYLVLALSIAIYQWRFEHQCLIINSNTPAPCHSHKHGGQDVNPFVQSTTPVATLALHWQDIYVDLQCTTGTSNSHSELKFTTGSKRKSHKPFMTLHLYKYLDIQMSMMWIEVSRCTDDYELFWINLF